SGEESRRRRESKPRQRGRASAETSPEAAPEVGLRAADLGRQTRGRWSMPRTPSTPKTDRHREPDCSIERCLQVLSDRWSFLILREALRDGVTRFADFQRNLGIAPNVLTNRLDNLVAAGVLTKRAYQEPGSRTRFSYHATAAGQDLVVILAALQ